MAQVKFSDLPAKTNTTGADIVAITDSADNLNKQVTLTNLIPDGAVTPVKINPGFDQDSTTSVGSTNSTTPQSMGLEVTVDVPANRYVRLSLNGRAYRAQSNAGIEVTIWDGAVGSGTRVASGLNGVGSSNSIPLNIIKNVLVSGGGSKTYRASFNRILGGSGDSVFITADATDPVTLSAEVV